MATPIRGWFASREAIKEALTLVGSERHRQIDRMASAATRHVERRLARNFYPVTQKREYAWPQRDGKAGTLFLDEDIIAVTALTDVGDTETAIPAGDFFLEPVNTGPPYYRIELDRASTEVFESHQDSDQRALRVTGRWGYGEDTQAAGTVVGSGINDTTGVTFECSNASLIDVGNVLKIGTESLFVTGRQMNDADSELTADIARDESVVAVPVNLIEKHFDGEVIQINSEKILIETVPAGTGTGNLTVIRAWDGSLLNSHTTADTVNQFRTLTVERGVNGTDAAAHADTVAIARYAPPEDVQHAALALAEWFYQNGGAGWSGQLGGGEQAVEGRGAIITKLIDDIAGHLKRRYVGAV